MGKVNGKGRTKKMNEKQKIKNFKEMWIFHEKKRKKKNRERMRKMKGKSEIIMNE